MKYFVCFLCSGLLLTSTDWLEKQQMAYSRIVQNCKLVERRQNGATKVKTYTLDTLVRYTRTDSLETFGTLRMEMVRRKSGNLLVKTTFYDGEHIFRKGANSPNFEIGEDQRFYKTKQFGIRLNRAVFYNETRLKDSMLRVLHNMPFDTTFLTEENYQQDWHILKKAFLKK